MENTDKIDAEVFDSGRGKKLKSVCINVLWL